MAPSRAMRSSCRLTRMTPTGRHGLDLFGPGVDVVDPNAVPMLPERRKTIGRSIGRR